MVTYPGDWEKRKVSDCVDIFQGGTPRTTNASYWDGNIIWVTPGEITKLNSLFISDSNRKITEVGLSCSSAKLMPIGSILLCTRATIGELAIAEKPMATNQGFKNLVCKPDVNNIYFSYLLMTLKPEMIKRAIGTTFLEISKTELGDIDVMLPSFPEQEAIAETITAFDTHIENLSALIEKKRAVRDGALEDLISGRTRLDGFSGEWKTYQMDTLGYVYNGLTGKSKNDFVCGGQKFIPFLNVLNNTVIDENALGSVFIAPSEKQNTVEVGDLFFNTSSETPDEVGMCATLLEDVGVCYLNSFCFGFRLITNEAKPLYLSYYFNSGVGRDFMRIHAQGSTRYNLSKTRFLQSYICVPSVDEQEAIVSVLTAMDEEITALEAERDKMTQIREGVMDDLLTGRVRLKV